MQPASLNTYAVILAGGSGTRFWPRSRQNLPKQLCKISNEKTLLENTLQRLDGYIPPERRLIVTHQDQRIKTQGIVDAACPQILAEPKACNTAAALALAALELRQKTGSEEALMLSLHADHIIEGALLETLEEAQTLARQGYLVLLGVQPTGPETAYGYIEKGSALDLPAAFRVASFKEKPDLATAAAYIERGYLWNSGLFVWKLSTILDAYRSELPKTLEILEEAQRKLGSFEDTQALTPYYAQLRSVPVDEAIFEKSKNAAVLEASFRWLDVGSFTALDQVLPHDAQENILQGPVLSLDSRNCTVLSEAEGPLIATLGVEGLVVVATRDAILVTTRKEAQNVKKIVEELKKRGLEKFT